MAERTMVRVTFLDHTSYEGERTMQELKRLEPAKCVVVGELLSETDDLLTVLCEYEKESPNVSGGGKLEHYAMVVLKCAVVKREELTKK